MADHFGMRRNPDDLAPDDLDFYPTPPIATQALLRAEAFSGRIWEPACGDGSMSEALLAGGHDVVSSDIEDRGYGTGGVDFLALSEAFDSEMLDRLRSPNIVTNPPYKRRMGQRFVEQALSLTTGKVAMVMRLQFLEGQERVGFFESTPLARIHVFSYRVNISSNWRTYGSCDGYGGMVPYVWYVWEHGHVGPATIHWLRKPDESVVAPAGAGDPSLALEEAAVGHELEDR